MKGREWDSRLRAMVAEPTPEMLLRLVLIGFRALLVDVRGLEVRDFASLDGEIRRAIGEGNSRTHPDKTLVIYDLRAYAQYLERTYGPSRFAEMAAQERDSISVLWLEGFSSYEAIGKETRRYHARPQATMVFVNPTPKARAIRIRMDFSTLQRDPPPLRTRLDPPPRSSPGRIRLPTAADPPARRLAPAVHADDQFLHGRSPCPGRLIAPHRRRTPAAPIPFTRPCPAVARPRRRCSAPGLPPCGRRSGGRTGKSRPSTARPSAASCRGCGPAGTAFWDPSLP